MTDRQIPAHDLIKLIATYTSCTWTQELIRQWNKGADESTMLERAAQADRQEWSER